ncbi:MAG: hypothetical protein CSA19_00745, partial [Deltaproteobacteria bacterium]
MQKGILVFEYVVTKPKRLDEVVNEFYGDVEKIKFVLPHNVHLGLMLQVVGEWERPRYQDEIKAWIKDFYCGTFSVQNVKFSKGYTSVEATAVSFSGNLKTIKNRHFKDTSIKKICAQLAREHSLKNKCDVDVDIPYVSQNHQSDLSFLQKLSLDFGATFSIKNNTLLFLKDKKNDECVIYEIDENECESWELEYTNKTLYGS